MFSLTWHIKVNAIYIHFSQEFLTLLYNIKIEE